MGLDMYLFRLKKSTILPVTFQGQLLEDLANQYPHICFFTDIDLKCDEYRDLQKYVTETTIPETVIDIDKLFADNNIDKNHAHIGGYGCTANGLEFMISHDDGSPATTLCIATDDHTYDKVVNTKVCYCEREQIFYWRKAYDIENLIYSELAPRDVQNCGYYKLKPASLAKILNETIKRYGDANGITDVWDNDYQKLNDPRGVFYYEWY